MQWAKSGGANTSIMEVVCVDRQVTQTKTGSREKKLSAPEEL